MLLSKTRLTKPVKQRPEVAKLRVMSSMGISGGRLACGGVALFEFVAAMVGIEVEKKPSHIYNFVWRVIFHNFACGVPLVT